MPVTAPTLLDPEHAAFIQGGVSISAGACDRDNRPAIARALGCHVNADRRVVRIFVSSMQARQVLERVRQTGALAVVFSQPSTHRTVQLKGIDARVTPLADGDLQQVRAYREAFCTELEPLGHPRVMVRTLLAVPPADLVAMEFTPTEAYTQTPGPKAGERLGSPA